MTGNTMLAIERSPFRRPCKSIVWVVWVVQRWATSCIVLLRAFWLVFVCMMINCALMNSGIRILPAMSHCRATDWDLGVGRGEDTWAVKVCRCWLNWQACARSVEVWRTPSSVFLYLSYRFSVFNYRITYQKKTCISLGSVGNILERGRVMVSLCVHSLY